MHTRALGCQLDQSCFQQFLDTSSRLKYESQVTLSRTHIRSAVASGWSVPHCTFCPVWKICVTTAYALSTISLVRSGMIGYRSAEYGARSPVNTRNTYLVSTAPLSPTFQSLFRLSPDPPCDCTLLLFAWLHVMSTLSCSSIGSAT